MKLDLGATCEFITAAIKIFEAHGYAQGSRWPHQVEFWVDDYCSCGYLHCVSDPSEVPEAIGDEDIGYSDSGKFYWYLDKSLDFVCQSMAGTPGFGDYGDLIGELVAAAEAVAAADLDKHNRILRAAKKAGIVGVDGLLQGLEMAFDAYFAHDAIPDNTAEDIPF